MSNATGATLMAAVESGSSGAEHSSMAGANLECRLISISPVQHVEIPGFFLDNPSRVAKGKETRTQVSVKLLQWLSWRLRLGTDFDFGFALGFVAIFLPIRDIIWDVWHLKQNQSVVV